MLIGVDDHDHRVGCLCSSGWVTIVIAVDGVGVHDRRCGVGDHAGLEWVIAWGG